MIRSVCLLLFLLFLANGLPQKESGADNWDDLKFFTSLMSREVSGVDQWTDLNVLTSAVSQELSQSLGPLFEPQLVSLENINEEERQRSESLKYCDKDLGCFSVGDPDFWNPLYRPINVLPRTREALNTKYLLYTSKNPREPHALVPSPNGTSLQVPGPFDPAKDTKFIVPGWIDRPSLVGWMQELTKGLLLRGDYNVVVVDWSGGNGPPYTLAVANARVVGAEMALLISNMQASGADLAKIHIIGHSLGAHVAGYAGQRLEALGRITGLDPAGPYFQNMPPSVRLDPTDAHFVDAWHTDDGPLLALGLGLSEAVGHVDFYPNGGKEQPGCRGQRISTVVTEGLVMGLRRFLGCNHERAIQLYLDAINSSPDQCSPSAFSCPDWDTFNAGHCSSCGNGHCANMTLDTGFNVNQLRSDSNQSLKLYLRTADRAPFCLHQYQVSIQLSKTGQDRQGRMYLKLSDHKGTVKADLGDSSQSLHPGATYQFLVTSSRQWPQTGDVSLEWRSSELSLAALFSKPYLQVHSMSVKPMIARKEYRSSRQDADEILTYSLPDNAPLYSRKPLKLVPMR